MLKKTMTNFQWQEQWKFGQSSKSYFFLEMRANGCTRLGISWWAGKSWSESDISQTASLTSGVSHRRKIESFIAMFPLVAGLTEILHLSLVAESWPFLPCQWILTKCDPVTILFLLRVALCCWVITAKGEGRKFPSGGPTGPLKRTNRSIKEDQ